MSQDNPQAKLMNARVLVVEDDAITRVQLRRMLSHIVTEVRVATDGAEGLALWREWRPDLVVADIMMPVMNGLDMSRAIKEEEPETQIIVVSSSSEVEHLRQALDIGIDRYVSKPVDERLLHDAIGKCLRDLRRLRDLRMARLVFEAAGEGVVVTDTKGTILAVNPAFCEISGYREDEALGQTPAMLSSGHHDAEFYRHMWESLRGLGRWSGEILNRRKNGEIYPEWLSIVAVDEPGMHTTRYIGLFSDITERKREEERIRRLAHYDVLTGLPNRILFGDHMQRSLARLHRRGGQMAVLYLDLDRFKPVNDNYGHAFGDQVLSEAARRMAACMRDTDTISRRGGDEFVATLEAQDAKDTAALVSRKLIEAISQPYLIEGRQVSIGASIGVAIYPDDGADAEDLLASADAALYTAKQDGRGDFRFYRSEDQRAVEARLSLDDALRRGLTEDRFQLRYLPEICLRHGRVDRLEALLRFRHPEGEIMDARHFMSHAEKLGITQDLGRLTLREAARAIAALSTAFPKLPAASRPGLTLDLSAQQLAGMGDVQDVLELLRSNNLPADAVTFEFPESAVTGNETGLANLHTLAEAGLQFALDDFGAGFCSFSLLQQLPLTAIKIDLFFIEEIETNPQSRELVAALIAFTKRLGIRTIAEGVDSPGQLAFLRENGCDAAQGFLFGEPLAAEELAPYLRERRWLRWFD
ncbi:MAG: EAL domain-containing protein [Pseudomonadota bacterium]|nr:EAL domain-containing protein [Pseudomonadota bacterium]